MYILNLEESLPNKTLRAVFLPDYFWDLQDDVIIFNETCILKFACSSYPLIFVVLKHHILHVHITGFLSVITLPR